LLCLAALLFLPAQFAFSGAGKSAALGTDAADEASLAAATGSIAGELWVDGNGTGSTDWNGLRDPGEPPLAGYTVLLFEAGSLTSPIEQTTTAADGAYRFEGLAAGSYVVGLASGFVGGTEYLLPMAVTSQSKLAVSWSSVPLRAFSEVLEITDQGEALSGINAGMRLPMGIAPAAAYSINLSSLGTLPTGTTWTSGSGTLAFTTASVAHTYTLTQSGATSVKVITVAGTTAAPGGPSITFSGVGAQINVSVTAGSPTLVLSGTSLQSTSTVNLAASTSPTLLLAGTNTIAGSILVASSGTLKLDSAASRGTGSTDGSLTVTVPQVSSGQSAAGIGGSGTQAVGTVIIDGGTITAIGGSSASGSNGAAGIGGGSGGAGGTVTINGGSVTATGGARGNGAGAGIGGGGDANNAGGSGGTVTITGGTVTATGGSAGGAGVGGGRGFTNGTGGTVSITGGNVTAISAGGPGIGGGGNSSVGTALTLGKNAEVKAYSSQSLAAFSQPAIYPASLWGDGFLVNAKLNGSISSTDTTLQAFGGSRSPVTLTLPGRFSAFAYSVGAGPSHYENIVASDAASGAPRGLLVRDDGTNQPEIPTINTLGGYSAYNGGLNNAVLPVKLMPNFTVAYLANGGSFAGGGTSYVFDTGVPLNSGSASVIILDAAAIGLNPPSPQHSFEGWNTAANGQGAAFSTDNRSTTTITSSLVLYAQFSTPPIDLSETTTSDPSGAYTVGAGMNPYSVQQPSGAGPVGGTLRSLTFNAAANGESFGIIQSGRLASPGNPAEPKHGTSIFGSIIVAASTSVTLVIDDIDVIGSISVGVNASLTLQLANSAGYGPSYLHGSIIKPAGNGPNTTLIVDSASATPTNPGPLDGSLVVTPTAANTMAVDFTGKVFVQGGSLVATGAGSADGANIRELTMDGGLFSVTGSNTGLSAMYIVINDGTLEGTNTNGGLVGGAIAATTSLKMSGGSLTATGAGMSAGVSGAAGTTVEIAGGVVDATGGSYFGVGAAGIGGGASAPAGTIKITGGVVRAEGGLSAAGIGGGAYGAGGTIAITGGTVTAIGGFFTNTGGSAIGGGFYGAGATIEIGPLATIKAYSMGNNSAPYEPPINASSLSGGGYFVNAIFDGSVDVDQFWIVDATTGVVLDTMDMPAHYTAFAYTTGAAKRDDVVIAVKDGAPVGDVVRKSNDLLTYSINTLNGYSADNPPDPTWLGVKLRAAYVIAERHVDVDGQPIPGQPDIITRIPVATPTYSKTLPAIAGYATLGYFIGHPFNPPTDSYTAGHNVSINPVTGHETVYMVYNDKSDLTVAKQVTGASGDYSKSFGFSVFLYADIDGLSALANQDYSYTITGRGISSPLTGKLNTDGNGKVTFALKHGQSIKITGLPLASYVRIVEETSSGYDTTFVDSADGQTEAGEDTLLPVGAGLRENLAGRTYTFYNERMAVPPAGLVQGHQPYTGLFGLALGLTYALVTLTAKNRLQVRPDHRKGRLS